MVFPRAEGLWVNERSEELQQHLDGRYICNVLVKNVATGFAGYLFTILILRLVITRKRTLAKPIDDRRGTKNAIL